MAMKKGRTVRAAERATYDACHALTLAGIIHTWSIDNDTGLWTIDTVEGLTKGEASELVAKVAASLDATQRATVIARLSDVVYVAPGTGKLEAGPIDHTARIAAAIAVLEPATVTVPAKPARKLAVVPATKPVAPASVPQPDVVAAWLDRLVYAPKRAYAQAWAAHMLNGEPCPDDPGTEWAAKVRARFDRLVAA